MTRALRAFSYGHGGLGVCLIALVAWYCLSYRVLPGSERSGRKAEMLLPGLYAAVCASIITELFLTTWYLFSPAYLDHIEASVASNVHYFLAGLPLYPPLDSYSFSGLLYGPLLTELNALGYVVFRDSFCAKLIGWLAGWIAVAVLATLSWRRARGTASLAALTYALAFLFSLGAALTADRSEPLLLLFAGCSLAVALNLKGLPGLTLLGLLCGAAMGLKAHAALYVAPSLYVWASGRTTQQWREEWKLAAACFCGATALVLVVPFLPQNVSLAGYLRYLTLAAKHGLSLDLFGRNCAFLSGLWAPILLLAGGFQQLRQAGGTWIGFALTVLGSECIVLVAASKPGAGIHHFMPFLAAHVLLFQDLYAFTPAASGLTPAAGGMVPAARGRAALALTAAVLGMITPTFQTFGSLIAFDLRLPEQLRQRDELLEFAMRFPRGMLGVSDDSSYQLANFRPWLTARGVSQTDYGAFMDLELSGATDEPLRSAFARCTIPFVYVPRPGVPFALTSSYRARPLFSDTLRREFAARYSRVESGVYFDVFACRTESEPHTTTP
jgi:hypothetical protein